MPGVAKLGKPKKATVVIKKTHTFTTYPKCYKSYKPLYEKVKNNNHHLAKALSKEKQENNLLFKRTVALDAENQDLIRSCNKRDRVMMTMLADAKSMINMLVTATGYLTNYISSCHEFTSRATPDMRLSCNSNGRRDSRRLSTKSPARGIVKPMVSGHTITKPTISLRRVNMQRINHPQSLSAIAESSLTPSRNEIANESGMADTPPSNRQNRYENKRVYRLPERLTVTSPRISDENKRRLSRRQSKRSGRLSDRHSHSRSTSSGFSESNDTNAQTETVETIDNPLVKLNDVSKLLKNSPRVNIRSLAKLDFVTNESTEDSDNILNDHSDNDILIPETQVSINMSNGDINKPTMTNDKEDHKKSVNNSHGKNHNKSKKHNNTSSFEDPLEGPSWLFNQPEDNSGFGNREKTFTNKKSRYDNDTKTENTRTVRYSEDGEESDVSLPSPGNLTYSGEPHCVNEETDNVTDDEGKKENSFCTITQPSRKLPHNAGMVDDEVATNFSRFITRRRGHREINDEDIDDFTLMVSRRPNRKQEFDINELRLPEVPTVEPESEVARRQNLQRQSDLNDLELPVLNCSNIVPTVRTETEPEITATIQKRVQNCARSIAFNSSMTENMGRTTIYNIMYNDETIKLPMLTDEDFYKEAMTETSKKSHVQKKNENQESELLDCTNDTGHMSTYKKKGKQEKKRSASKDPSSAKVVLQKLSESHVKQRSPPLENTTSRESGRSQRKSFVPLTAENSSDSDCSNASTSRQDRPRRRKAPKNLREPCLNKKLRREI